MQRQQTYKPTSSRRKRRKLCCAAVSAAHFSGELMCSFLMRHPSNSRRTKVRLSVNPARQDVNGQAVWMYE